VGNLSSRVTTGTSRRTTIHGVSYKKKFFYFHSDTADSKQGTGKKIVKNQMWYLGACEEYMATGLWSACFYLHQPGPVYHHHIPNLPLMSLTFPASCWSVQTLLPLYFLPISMPPSPVSFTPPWRQRQHSPLKHR